MTSRTWATGPTGETPITADWLNGIEADLDARIQTTAKGAPGGVATLGNDGKIPPAQIPASANLQPWAPSTVYAAGQQVVSPSGDTVTAFAAHTSGATYNSDNWYGNFGYLFANFTYNSLDGEKLNLFNSGDGVTVAGHGPNPVYAPTTGVRDPSVKKIGNTWFMAYGFDQATNQTSFAVASSPDLLNWTLVTTISAASSTGILQAWAPEITIDSNGDVYIFYTNNTTTSTMEMWYVKATDATGLTTWGAPTKLSWTSQPTKAMDAVFQQVGSTWYMFYGDNNYICRATASGLLGPWTTDKSGDWAGWGINREAPELVRVSSTKWRLYIDRYAGTSPNWTYPGYGYTESADLTTWTPLVPVTMGPDVPGIVLRHGSFIKISDSATAALVQAVMDSGAGTRREAEFTASTSLTSGSETQVGVLTLDTARSFNTSDFSRPANGQVKVGATGLYMFAIHAGYNSNNFGNGTTNQWVSINSPTIGNNVARNVSAGGYELTATTGGIYMNAGDVVEFRLAQFTGATKTVDSRIRCTRLA